MHELIDILKIGIISYIFIQLMQPGMVFYFYYKLIDKIKYDWIFKPIGGCLACFAGQFSCWFYLIKYFHSYNFFEHIFFISATILVVMIFDKLIDYEGTEGT